jgi:hypothetical protein
LCRRSLLLLLFLPIAADVVVPLRVVPLRRRFVVAAVVAVVGVHLVAAVSVAAADFVGLRHRCCGSIAFFMNALAFSELTLLLFLTAGVKTNFT